MIYYGFMNRDIPHSETEVLCDCSWFSGAEVKLGFAENPSISSMFKVISQIVLVQTKVIALHKPLL